MIEDISEDQSVSKYIAGLERRGIIVQSIETGEITRENFTWGFDKTSGQHVTTNWTIHFGGPLQGGHVKIRQKVWLYDKSSDPRHADQPPKRWSIEFMPDSMETHRALKARRVLEEEDA